MVNSLLGRTALLRLKLRAFRGKPRCACRRRLACWSAPAASAGAPCYQPSPSRPCGNPARLPRREPSRTRWLRCSPDSWLRAMRRLLRGPRLRRQLLPRTPPGLGLALRGGCGCAGWSLPGGLAGRPLPASTPCSAEGCACKLSRHPKPLPPFRATVRSACEHRLGLSGNEPMGPSACRSGRGGCTAGRSFGCKSCCSAAGGRPGAAAAEAGGAPEPGTGARPAEPEPEAVELRQTIVNVPVSFHVAGDWELQMRAPAAVAAGEPVEPDGDDG